MIHMAAVDLRRLAERLHQLIAACHGTRKRAADTDMILARCHLAETWIEGHHLQHLDRLQAQLRRDPVDNLIADEAELMLHEMQQRQHGAALRNGVMRDHLVDFAFQFSGNCQGHRQSGQKVSCSGDEQISGRTHPSRSRDCPAQKAHRSGDGRGASSTEGSD